MRPVLVWYTDDISRYNITRYFIQHNNFEGETSIRLRTYERRLYLTITGQWRQDIGSAITIVPDATVVSACNYLHKYSHRGTVKANVSLQPAGEVLLRSLVAWTYALNSSSLSHIYHMLPVAAEEFTWYKRISSSERHHSGGLQRAGFKFYSTMYKSYLILPANDILPCFVYTTCCNICSYSPAK